VHRCMHPSECRLQRISIACMHTAPRGELGPESGSPPHTRQTRALSEFADYRVNTNTLSSRNCCTRPLHSEHCPTPAEAKPRAVLIACLAYFQFLLVTVAVRSVSAKWHRHAIHSRTAHQSRQFLASHRLHTSSKATCRTMAMLFGHTHDSLSDNQARLLVTCTQRADHGNLWPGRGSV
jgi:hypothetical protein